MKYPLHDLNDEEFESMVVSICEEILGIGTINFTKGKDGGRDAKFSGTANNFPSSKNPWSGKFIIQAKHTTKPNASCSDSDFTTKLKKEIISIESLKDDYKVDFYLLFTNRKLSGVQDPKIEDLIHENLGIKNVIIAEEKIQKILQDNPIIAKKHNLKKLLLPLDFYDDDIKDIIVNFANIEFNGHALKEIHATNERIPIEEKNKLNGLSKSYFNNIFKQSMNEFNQIEAFFKNPQNKKMANMYENTVRDIQEKIIIKRSEYNEFEEVLAFLYDSVLNNHKDEILEHRRLIRVFLHYMYYHCDIGIME